MKKNYITPTLFVVATFIAACSVMPTTTNLLDQTHSDYQAAKNNPNVEVYAPQEMRLAGEALRRADDAAIHRNSAEKIDELAYLAKQQIALTQEMAKQKAAEVEIANAGKERNRVRLEQRTNEADQAKLETQIAQSETAEAKARTAQLEAQLADLSARKTERGMIITLGDVLFGTDLARLNAAGMRTAQKLANVLQQNPQRTVLIEGFADSTGSESHNQGLSERRAMAVSNALQELGVARERVATKGYGEKYPVASNSTAQNRQLNRRVEIVLSDAAGKVLPR